MDLDRFIFSQDGDMLFAYTLQSNPTRLEALISLIPRNRAYLCVGIVGALLPAVKRAFESCGFHQSFEYYGDAYYLPRSEASQFQVVPPPGVYLKKLTEANVDRIDGIYRHRGPTTSKQFKKLIRCNFNIGAFDSNDNLMAWCLKHQSWTFAALQVEVKYQRRGLGSLVVKQMAKAFAQQGEDSLAIVEVGNVAGRALFTRLGFKQLDIKVMLLKYEP